MSIILLASMRKLVNCYKETAVARSRVSGTSVGEAVEYSMSITSGVPRECFRMGDGSAPAPSGVK